jgi:hypothetical protein
MGQALCLTLFRWFMANRRTRNPEGATPISELESVSENIRVVELELKKSTPISSIDKNIHINSVMDKIIGNLLPIFIIANLLLFVFIAVVFHFDRLSMIEGIIKPEDRLIDNKVIISLIAATATEISVLIIAAIKKMQ